MIVCGVGIERGSEDDWRYLGKYEFLAVPRAGDAISLRHDQGYLELVVNRIEHRPMEHPRPNDLMNTDRQESSVTIVCE